MINLNFVFKSSDHLRYENGIHVSGPHGGAGRAVKVEPNINGGKGFTVTLYNLDGNHPLWQNNIQMAPKQMEIINQTNNKIELRGYGYDSMGSSFSDYGLTILFRDDSIDKCILHMLDRNVDIEYLKADEQSLGNHNTANNDFVKEKDFIHKWSKMPMNIKIEIADKTDALNNIGVVYESRNDIENAINYYNQALEIMPINDDALANLINCYSTTNNQTKLLETEKKLDYLKRMGI